MGHSGRQSQVSRGWVGEEKRGVCVCVCGGGGRDGCVCGGGGGRV